MTTTPPCRRTPLTALFSYANTAARRYYHPHPHPHPPQLKPVNVASHKNNLPPVAPQGVKPTVQAVSPLPATVDTFLRSFPTFNSVGFHPVSRTAVAATPIRKDLISMAVIWQNNCKRLGRHKRKDRSEVSGSNKKVRPQKGTGKARVGDKRPPHWRGGGRAHAKKPQDYSTELTLKVKQQAMRAALTVKFVQNQMTVVDSLRERRPGSAPHETPSLPLAIPPTKKELEAMYEENKSELQSRLETLLERNDHRNFTEPRRPEDSESQYRNIINDEPNHQEKPSKHHGVLLCVARDPVEDKEMLDAEKAGKVVDPERPLGEHLDTYWNLYEAAHHSDRVEVVHVKELDVLRIMKYKNLIIEKDALDLLVEQL